MQHSVLYFYNNDRPYTIESENVRLIRFSFGFKMLINNQLWTIAICFLTGGYYY